jgi:LPS O-antigen subunit length determinant protein (WzzB/FepE family)
VTATTRRNSLIIAAMVGLIVGTGLALAWEALATRPRREQPA